MDAGRVASLPVVLLALMLGLPNSVEADSSADETLAEGRAVMDRVIENRPEEGYRAEARLIESARGRTIRRLRAELLMRREGDAARFFYRITRPEELAGTALLVAEDPPLPTRYILREPEGTTTEVRGADLERPFADTQFSIQDLGFDFVRWPGQTVLYLDRSKGFQCYVVESRPAASAANPYARVLTWVKLRQFVPLRCEAYNAGDRIVRRIEVRSFDPQQKSVRKLEARAGGDVRTLMDVVDIDFGYPGDREWAEAAAMESAVSADPAPPDPSTAR
jgi:hypothetical protein